MRYETNSKSLLIHNTENGYLSNMVLRGKTFVNLAKLNEVTINDLSTSSNGIDFNSVQILRKGKPYTVIITLKNYIGDKPIKFRQRKLDTHWNYYPNVPFNDYKDGIKMFTFTPSEDFKDCSFYIDVNGTTSTSVTISQGIILEGDYTQNPLSSYFEGLQSVGDDVDKIEVFSRKEDENLHDVNTCARDMYLDKNKGTVPKPYTLHKSDKKQLLYLDPQKNTWEKPVLREWDTVEKHSDGRYYYHKNSEEIVLNGNEHWQTMGLSATGLGDYLGVFIPISNGKITDIKTNYVIDTHGFSDLELNTINNNGCMGEAVNIHSNGNFYIRIAKSRLETQDIEGFKKWLQANNVTVVYQLAQEEIYDCTPISVASYKGDTIYQIESGSISPHSSFELDYTLSNAVARVSDAKVFNKAMVDNLRQNLINKGVKVTSEDKMSSLINKVRDIEVEGHNLPKWYKRSGEWISGAKVALELTKNSGGASVRDKIYCIGGYTNTYTNLNMEYDTSENIWSYKAEMPTKRSYLATSSVGDKIYCIGGYDGVTDVDINECYDTLTDTWSTKSSMQTSREGLTSSVVGDKIYCINGRPKNGSYLDVNECYDVVTDTWSTKTNSPLKSIWGTSSSVGDKIYCIGGMIGSSSYTSANHCYDTLTDTWSTKSSMTNKRASLASSSIEDKIYVVGGTSGSILYNANECYDPATDTWTVKRYMPTNRRDLIAVSVKNIMYVINGFASNSMGICNDCYIP